MEIEEDRVNKGETSIDFSPQESFTRFVINFARNTLKETEMGFTAHPINSSDIIEIDLPDDDEYQNLVYIAIGNGKTHYSKAQFEINQETYKTLMKYLKNIIAKIRYSKDIRNLSYVPKISLSSPVPLVEDVEGHIGSFMTGEKGSVQQQTNKIRKKIKNLNGGRATRRQRKRQA
jgi:poly-D-alanine transfer protein DltD